MASVGTPLPGGFRPTQGFDLWTNFKWAVQGTGQDGIARSSVMGKRLLWAWAKFPPSQQGRRDRAPCEGVDLTEA